MQENLNKDWMDNYEITYSKYKNEWDEHYEKVQSFIKASLPEAISNWGFIGVTSTIPEINTKMLENVETLTFLDIYQEGMYRARKYVSKQHNFSNIAIRLFDSTYGFVSQILSEFAQYDDGLIEKEYLLKSLNRLSPIEVNYKGTQYDFITHMGLMDYYLMPIFLKYCNHFKELYNEFFFVMKKLNDKAVNVSLKYLYQLLDSNGRLVISTPTSRIPKGDICNESLFWEKPIELHVEETGFRIIMKTTHIWKEFPEDNGHSHEITNILCSKI